MNPIRKPRWRILFAVAALIAFSASGQTTSAPKPSLALHQIEFLLDGYRTQILASSATRNDIKQATTLYRSAPSPARASAFRQLVQQVSKPASTRQVDELVGIAVYQSTVTRAPALSAALGRLHARLDQTIRLRNQLRCKEDVGLNAPRNAREALKRARTHCTPLAQTNNTTLLFRQLDTVARPVVRLEAALQSGDQKQLNIAVSQLALSDQESSQLLALVAKLNISDSNNPDEERKKQLLLALKTAREKYNAYRQQCLEGDELACSKMAQLATEIAELTAKLQALG